MGGKDLAAARARALGKGGPRAEPATAATHSADDDAGALRAGSNNDNEPPESGGGWGAEPRHVALTLLAALEDEVAVDLEEGIP